jgi:bifunctional UDP-N-acetylglucosamine pyrophosphorylase/glucosamine-1-phosphate N-acetyltransferase
MNFLEAEILYMPVAEWLRQAIEPVCGMDITTAEQLANARAQARRYVNLRFMERGVDILDIDTVYIHPLTQIGRGTVVYPCTVIRGDVVIGADCSIGPFAYLRPGTRLGNGVKAGDFVEIKNSTLGERASVSHLTYIGDTDVGAAVNVGCGTVTVNYDGKSKHRTVIGDGAFIGCNTNLVAPVTVGRNAYTAAGSTITSDVPDNALAVARERQLIREGWTPPRERGT